MDLEQIYEKLESVDGKVDTLLVWKARIDERCKAHRQQTDELRETVFENPGLKSKVERLWNCKKAMTRQKEFWLGVLRTVLSYGIIGIAVWLLFIFKKVV